MFFSNVIKTTFISAVLVSFSACGGGGKTAGAGEIPSLSSISAYSSSSSAASSAISIAKKPQTLTFKDNGPSPVYGGAVFSNPAVGQGTGAVTYLSSDTTLGTVDSQGVVTMAQPLDLFQQHVLIITATVAADDIYEASTASYRVGITQIACAHYNKTVTFAENQVELLPGATFSNTVTKSGFGAIIFSSSNTSVASIDSSGLVTALASGETIISATLNGDDCRAPAFANYTVKVFERAITSTKVKERITPLPPAEVAISAWIGAKDSLISFPSHSGGFTFYSSSESDCDFSHVANCANGQFTLLSGATLIDTATTLTQPGYYLLKDSDDITSFTLFSRTAFAPRAEHQLVIYDHKLLLIGGYLGLRNLESPELKNDVWSSSDGISWTEQTTNAGFSPRTGQKVVNFNNTLWLIGGNDRTLDYLIPGDDNGRKNDVWSSKDGIIWTQQLGKASFSPRTGHEVVAFNNKLWVIGGDDKNGLKNDIWSSSNGITWVRETANAGFSPRADHQVKLFNGKLWLVGGGDKNDIWSSADGITWTEETADASFTAKTGYTVAVYANKLWVIGGYDNGDYSNQVWSSSDGVTWQRAEPAAFTPCAHCQLVSFADRLMMVGGYTQAGFSNEIWSTIDGVEWRKGFGGTFQRLQ